MQKGGRTRILIRDEYNEIDHRSAVSVESEYVISRERSTAQVLERETHTQRESLDRTTSAGTDFIDRHKLDHSKLNSENECKGTHFVPVGIEAGAEDIPSAAGFKAADFASKSCAVVPPLSEGVPASSFQP